LRDLQPGKVVAGSEHEATEIYGGLEVNLHALLNLALDGEAVALPARKWTMVSTESLVLVLLLWAHFLKTPDSGAPHLVLRYMSKQLSKTKLNSVTLVRERTIPTEQPPLVGEVSANFCG
jgi:hypothetical protein